MVTIEIEKDGQFGLFTSPSSNVPCIWQVSSYSSPTLLSYEPTTSISTTHKSKMQPFFFLLLLFTSSFIPTQSQSQSQPKNQAFISLLITQNGLNFVKNILIQNAISSIVSLQLPNIEKGTRIPMLGGVYFVLSNITMHEIDVDSSNVKPGESGIEILASGVSCNLSLDWYYEYSSIWFGPVKVSDQGSAQVQV